MIDCPNKCEFGVIILRKELTKHLKSECLLRPYQCGYCGIKDTYARITGKIPPGIPNPFGGKEHYDECPAYPLTCPNKCGLNGILRKDMAKHRSKCPQEFVECPFAEAGCRMYNLPRCQLEHHLSSNQQQHLLLVMGAYKQVKSQLRETEAKLTTAVQLLRRGREADKEIVDAIVICSTNLKKKGDKVIVTMPRISEYHRSGKVWHSAPFYYKEGYRMCLAVNIEKMVSGVCTCVSMGICLLKGERDEQLKWPIGDKQCRQAPPPPPPCGMLNVKYVSFHMCTFQQLQQKNERLLSPCDTYFDLVNDCLTFTVRYMYAACDGYLKVEVEYK